MQETVSAGQEEGGVDKRTDSILNSLEKLLRFLPMNTLPKPVSKLFSVSTIPGKDQQFMQAGQVIGKNGLWGIKQRGRSVSKGR